MQTTIHCPETGAALDFEIPGDEETLPEYWTHPVRVHCPVCQQVHVVPYRHAYVKSVMAEFACMPADLKEARLH